jgi:hypothetical protein
MNEKPKTRKQMGTKPTRNPHQLPTLETQQRGDTMTHTTNPLIVTAWFFITEPELCHIVINSFDSQKELEEAIIDCRTSYGERGLKDPIIYASNETEATR